MTGTRFKPAFDRKLPLIVASILAMFIPMFLPVAIALGFLLLSDVLAYGFELLGDRLAPGGTSVDDAG